MRKNMRTPVHHFNFNSNRRILNIELSDDNNFIPVSSSYINFIIITRSLYASKNNIPPFVNQIMDLPRIFKTLSINNIDFVSFFLISITIFILVSLCWISKFG